MNKLFTMFLMFCFMLIITTVIYAENVQPVFGDELVATQTFSLEKIPILGDTSPSVDNYKKTDMSCAGACHRSTQLAVRSRQILQTFK